MRRRRRKTVVLAPGQQRLAERIATSLLGFQRRLADRLNDITSRWTLLRWKISLVVFALGFGSYCAYLIWHAME